MYFTLNNIEMVIVVDVVDVFKTVTRIMMVIQKKWNSLLQIKGGRAMIRKMKITIKKMWKVSAINVALQAIGLYLSYTKIS